MVVAGHWAVVCGDDHSVEILRIRSDMKIIVIRGLPGAGKTRLRTEKYPDLPCLDMAELRKQTENTYAGWRESMHILFNELFNHMHAGSPAVVVEGIFQDETASLTWLQNYCHDRDIDVELESVEAPFDVLVSRLLKDYQDDKDLLRLIGRTYLAAKYAGGF